MPLMMVHAAAEICKTSRQIAAIANKYYVHMHSPGAAADDSNPRCHSRESAGLATVGSKMGGRADAGQL